MYRIFPVLFVALTPHTATAQPSTVIRVDGIVESIEGTVPTTLNSPFVLRLSIEGEIQEKGIYEGVTDEGVPASYGHMLFGTDIALTAGSFQNTWTSQFGAMALSKNDIGGDLLFDVGTDVNMYIAKRGPDGPSAIDFSSGIDFLMNGDFQNVSMDFFFEPSAAGAFGGRITKIEVVPERLFQRC